MATSVQAVETHSEHTCNFWDRLPNALDRLVAELLLNKNMQGLGIMPLPRFLNLLSDADSKCVLIFI